MPGALRRAGGAAQRRLAEPGSIPRSGRRSFRSPHTNRPACVAIASCMEKGQKKKRDEARPFISHDDAATAYSAAAPSQIGRAQVCTPLPNAHIVCRLLVEKNKQLTKNTHYTQRT